MADVSDVVSTLVGLISGIIYPNGTAQPSVGGVDARVVAGWPVPATLAADLAANTAEIAVYPLAGERNTTRYLEQWIQTSINTPTLNLAASGQTVTVGGTIPPASNPHNAVVFVNGVPYVYAVQPTDTLTGIASALAALISMAVSGTLSSGPVITLPAGARLGAVRIGVSGSSAMLIKNQEKRFQIAIFANKPQFRTSLAKTLDPALSAMSFIALPDLTAGRIRYFGNFEDDRVQKQGVYRRDLFYTVDYATILERQDTQVTQEQFNISVDTAGILPARPAATIYE